MVIILLFLWVVAVLAVPVAAVMIQACWRLNHWSRFHLPTYLLAWAGVAVLEIVVVISITGESMAVFMVGFWSTFGAIFAGLVWWLGTRDTVTDAMETD